MNFFHFLASFLNKEVNYELVILNNLLANSCDRKKVIIYYTNDYFSRIKTKIISAVLLILVQKLCVDIPCKLTDSRKRRAPISCYAWFYFITILASTK